MAVHQIGRHYREKLYLTHMSVLVAQIKKLKKADWHFVGQTWSSLDLPNPNTNTQIHKHTNTQIQHMTKCQKNPTCGISLKRGLFKDIKNYVPMFLHRIDEIS